MPWASTIVRFQRNHFDDFYFLSDFGILGFQLAKQTPRMKCSEREINCLIFGPTSGAVDEDRSETTFGTLLKRMNFQKVSSTDSALVFVCARLTLLMTANLSFLTFSVFIRTHRIFFASIYILRRTYLLSRIGRRLVALLLHILRGLSLPKMPECNVMCSTQMVEFGWPKH